MKKTVVALTVALFACTSQDIKSIEYYTKNPKEANKELMKCQFATSEENPKNCSNALEAMQILEKRIRDKHSRVIERKTRNSSDAF